MESCTYDDAYFTVLLQSSYYFHFIGLFILTHSLKIKCVLDKVVSKLVGIFFKFRFDYIIATRHSGIFVKTSHFCVWLQIQQIISFLMHYIWTIRCFYCFIVVSSYISTIISYASWTTSVTKWTCQLVKLLRVQEFIQINRFFLHNVVFGFVYPLILYEQNPFTVRNNKKHYIYVELKPDLKLILSNGWGLTRFIHTIWEIHFSKYGNQFIEVVCKRFMSISKFCSKASKFMCWYNIILYVFHHDSQWNKNYHILNYFLSCIHSSLSWI